MAEPLTAEGTIVGTFQYMAPEQLEGGEADARSDIWALGCVLYEMATGKRAFEGKSQASLIAAILEREPAPIAEIQPTSPAGLDRLIRGCLAKDPDDRVQTAHDVKLQLQWIGADPAGGTAGGTGRRGAFPEHARSPGACVARRHRGGGGAGVHGGQPPGGARRDDLERIRAEDLPDADHIQRALHARRQDDRVERRASRATTPSCSSSGPTTPNRSRSARRTCTCSPSLPVGSCSS